MLVIGAIASCIRRVWGVYASAGREDVVCNRLSAVPMGSSIFSQLDHGMSYLEMCISVIDTMLSCREPNLQVRFGHEWACVCALLLLYFF